MKKPEVLEGNLWHNADAQALAHSIGKVIRAWESGAICPQEFLAQLDDEVSSAKRDRDSRIRKAREARKAKEGTDR